METDCSARQVVPPERARSRPREGGEVSLAAGFLFQIYVVINILNVSVDFFAFDMSLTLLPSGRMPSGIRHAADQDGGSPKALLVVVMAPIIHIHTHIYIYIYNYVLTLLVSLVLLSILLGPRCPEDPSDRMGR